MEQHRSKWIEDNKGLSPSELRVFEYWQAYYDEETADKLARLAFCDGGRAYIALKASVLGISFNGALMRARP